MDHDERDLENILKERTKQDYGLKYEVTQYGFIKCDFLHNIKANGCKTDKHDLRFLWEWFDQIYRIFEQNSTNKLNFQEYFYMRYYGLNLLLDGMFTVRKDFFFNLNFFQRIFE